MISSLILLVLTFLGVLIMLYIFGKMLELARESPLAGIVAVVALIGFVLWLVSAMFGG